MKDIILFLIMLIGIMLFLIGSIHAQETPEQILKRYIEIDKRINELESIPDEEKTTKQWRELVQLKEEQNQLLQKLREMESEDIDFFITTLKAEIEKYKELNETALQRLEDQEQYLQSIQMLFDELKSYHSYTEKIIEEYENKLSFKQSNVIALSLGVSYFGNVYSDIRYLFTGLNWLTFGGGIYFEYFTVEKNFQFGLLISLGVKF